MGLSLPSTYSNVPVMQMNANTKLVPLRARKNRLNPELLNSQTSQIAERT